MRRLAFAALLLALPILGCASPPTPHPPPPPAATRDGRWQQDLRYLADELPRIHGNVFHDITPAEFEAAVAALDCDIPELSDHEIAVAMARIVAAVDDAHTYLDFRKRRYPIAFWWFADGLHVTATDEANRDCLQGQLLSIGGHAADEVVRRVASLVAAEDSESWLRIKVVDLLPYEETLQGLGLSASGASEAVFAIKTADGTTREVALRPIAPGETVALVSAAQQWPKYRMRTDAYWFETWNDSKTLYAQYNRCTEDPDYPFRRFVAELMAAWDRETPERLILDLRGNGGGNSEVINPLLDAIRARPALNRRGKLFVLSGRATFSSAALNVLDFAEETEALIVGLPPGGNPFSPFREATSFRLPNSQLQVGCTWRYVPHPATWRTKRFEPDLRVESSALDFFAGRDVEVQAVLGFRESPR